MYKSYPILVTYMILVLFSALEIAYEFYMGFACGEHDCFDFLIDAIQPIHSEVYHFNLRHRSKIEVIAILWKVR